MVKGATITLIGAALSALAACSSDDPGARSEGAYCASVGAHLTELNATSFAADGGVDSALDAWREVSSHAPVAIEREWAAMTGLLATAVTVDVADPADVQHVADTARLHEPDATRIIEYTYALCQVAIGGVVPTTVPLTVPPEATGIGESTTVAVTATTTAP